MTFNSNPADHHQNNIIKTILKVSGIPQYPTIIASDDSHHRYLFEKHRAY